MDPRKFDEAIARLSQGVSRRSLVGGSIGAALLAAVGLQSQAEAKNNKGKHKGRGNGNGKGKGRGKDNDKTRTICHCGSGDPSQCQTITVGKKAADSHLKHHCDYGGPCRDDVVNPCEPESECLAVVDTEGDVTEENGEFTAHAEGTTFGNLIFGVPADTTFADIASIQSDFDFSEGHCGVGSPRFVVFLEGGNCPYVQFPPDECSAEGASGSTGELVGNNTPFVWNDDLCGGNAANHTYDDVLAAYGDQTISQIVLVTDSSSGTATVTLDPCITLA